MFTILKVFNKKQVIKKEMMNMAKLYIITGPAGVGKSTISKGIAESSEKSVLIEGDEIYHQVVGGYVPAWKEGNHLDVFWKVCMDIIKDYLDYGYDVIFNYIIEKERFHELKEQFSNIDMKFIVLLLKEETLLQRDKERPEGCQMKERCLVLLKEFIDYQYDEKNILYTDNLTIEETIKEVIFNDRFLTK